MQRTRSVKKRRLVHEGIPEDTKLLALRIVVDYICKNSLSRRLLQSLYAFNLGKTALRHTITKQTLRVEEMSQAHLTDCLKDLKKFQSLRHLTIERGRHGVQWIRPLFGLSDLIQLKKLTLKRCPGGDQDFLGAISDLSRIEEVVIEDPKGYTAQDLAAICSLKELRAFSLVSLYDTATSCNFEMLTQRCTKLERLSLAVGNHCLLQNLSSIARLACLHTLEVCCPYLPLQINALSSMTALRCLTIDCILPSQEEESLQKLTWLTALKFQSSLPWFPTWIENLTCLKSLYIFWIFSYRPGVLSNRCPASLKELTLRGIKGPIKSELLSDLSLLKVRLYYTLPKNVRGEKISADHFTKCEDLLLRCASSGSASDLKNFSGWKCLTKLDIETRGTIKLDAIRNGSPQLKDLSIGIDFTDNDFHTLSKMSTLEVLALKYTDITTGDRCVLLSRLPKLRDLCLYSCNNFTMTPTITAFFLSEFHSLIHLGISPLSEENSQIIPSDFGEFDLRAGPFGMGEHNGIAEHPLFARLNPRYVSNALVVDDGYRMLKIDADCRLD